MERISSRSSSGEALQTSVGGEFGVANILNLLRISATGSRSRSRSADDATERSQERYHTYGSLLHKLRRALDEEGILRRNPKDAAPGDFIEVSGVFRSSPLAASLRTMSRLIDLFGAMAGGTSTSGRQKGKSNARGESQGSDSMPGRREITQMQGMLEGILNDVELGDIRTLVVDLDRDEAYTAVTSIFVEYLRDQTMTELAYREYRLPGKVVGNLKGTGETIDLLRGTGISGAGDEALSSFENGAEWARPAGDGTSDFLSALEVLPIAVYV
ncbi:MAG: hypothetical protein QOH16_710 [Gaiellaceae bacterium]|nr:hypothetical protein [Gaiellaceae bacterium]